MKIAILTNFRVSKPEYSLYSVAIAQASALASAGNEVFLFVLENYEQKHPLPAGFAARILPVIPPPKTNRPEDHRSGLVDYREEGEVSADHRKYVQVLAQWLEKNLEGIDAVFTHDWVYTGWNLPFFLALEQAAPKTRAQKFLHWIHSIPGMQRSWWYLRRLGERNHKLVYPNSAGRLRVANFFNTDLKNVFFIPHIVDLALLMQWDEEIVEFVNEHPALMDAHIVQVYPAGSDRMDAKGVRELILLFSKFKARGLSVCLLIVNQSANNATVQRKIDHLCNLARRNGLQVGEEIIFMSEEREQFRVGIPHHLLMQLAQCCNVFIFPTQMETFGLVLPEIVLASGALPVVNKSLPELVEVAGMTGILAEFGSYCSEWIPTDENAWLEHLAGVIVHQIMAEEGVRARTFFRRRYSQRTVYYQYYVPILEGVDLW